MAEKKKEEAFVVTDRRLFTPEGELRQEVVDEEAPPSKPGPQRVEASPQPAPATQADVPPAPSASEQKQQADAYRRSKKDLDSRVELSGQSSKDLEMTFERFLASLYMTAMMQLGLMREEGGQRRIYLIGARQTLQTLSLRTQ